MNWQNDLTDHFRDKGKLVTLAGLTAVQDLQKSATEQQKNREAESSWARKNLWGVTDVAQSEDVGNTILGDVTTPAPVIIQQPAQQPQGNTLLTAAALAATLGLGSAAGYILSNKNPTPPQPVQQVVGDESVSIGLGTLEEYGLK